MIIVNLSQTWPKVLAGELNAADVTLGAWALIKDSNLEDHADTILGTYRNVVVTAFDIESWKRENKRVTFVGTPSVKWGHLVGTPNPGKQWVSGMANPVQVLPTTVLTEGNVPIEDTPAGRRAVVDGYVLTVEGGFATLQVPEGGTVNVRTRSTQTGVTQGKYPLGKIDPTPAQQAEFDALVDRFRAEGFDESSAIEAAAIGAGYSGGDVIHDSDGPEAEHDMRGLNAPLNR